jgi:nucleotide-binding universal stress UspA family protein
MITDATPARSPRNSLERTSLGLSDIIEDKRNKIRKVVFAVGNLDMLGETLAAWAWAYKSILHKDDNLHVVHVHPFLDPFPVSYTGPVLSGGVPLSSVYQKLLLSKDGSWLPSPIRRALVKFLLHRVVLLKPPPSKELGDVLVDYVRKEKIDFVLMGSCDLGPTAKLLMGSTSSYLVTNCPCPCIVIRRPPAATHEWTLSRPRHVVIALDSDTVRSDAVISWSLQNCLLTDDIVTILSCIEGLGERPKRRLYLEKFVQQIGSFQGEQRSKPIVHVHVMVGSAGPVITAAVQNAEPKVDFFIAGSNGKNGLMRFAFGSVSSYFMDNVTCPVCIVRRDQA